MKFTKKYRETSSPKIEKLTEANTNMCMMSLHQVTQNESLLENKYLNITILKL